MFSKVRYLLIGQILAMISAQSLAGSFQCVGKVDNLFVSRAGSIELYSLEAYGNGDGRVLCNVKTAWKTVEPETCKVWYSTLLSDIARSKSVKIIYLDTEAANCNSVPLYSNSVAPYGVGEN